jgi:cysteine desulfurase
MIYFDHNATAPVIPEAKQAWLDATEKFIGNPSSPHRIGLRADTALSEAREKLATILGCDPLDIVWTSGATESNNMVLHHFARSLPSTAEVWVSAIEHPCVVEATQHYFPGRHRFIRVTHAGVIDLDWLAEELSEKRPGMVGIMAANNITGVLQPWREALAICRQYEVPFFCDAVQWLGKLPSAGLGACDFLTGCAHKFGGPRGIGFLKCPLRGRVRPLLLGGPQEESRRAGTENVSGAISLVAALEVREALIEAGKAKESTTWRDRFETTLRNSLPEIEIAGGGQKRLWNTSATLMPPIGAQRWVVKLDKLGFAVSIGSACSTGKETASHVLLAMGFEHGQAGRVLRFSSGWESKPSEWDELAAAVIQVYADAHPVKNRSQNAGRPLPQEREHS